METSNCRDTTRGGANASATFDVNTNCPLCVGVPDNTPALLNVSPGGR